MALIKLAVLVVLTAVVSSTPLPQADGAQAVDNGSVLIAAGNELLPLSKFIDFDQMFNIKYLHKKIAELCGVILPHLKGHPILKALVLKIQEEVLKHSPFAKIMAAIKPIIERLLRPVLTRMVQGFVSGILSALSNAFFPVAEAVFADTPGAAHVAQAMATQYNPQPFAIEIPEINRPSFYIAPPQMLFRRRRNAQNDGNRANNYLHSTPRLRVILPENESKSSPSDNQEDRSNNIHR